ncbi:MAG: hypothetical protein MUO42_11795 [Anaerolineaceae bacterium]|nr:hypothetical protein [Anaerolineaceae bacterium]
MPELEGAEMGFAEYSSCIPAVVNWFGLVDLLKMDAQLEGTVCPGGYNDTTFAESQLVGAPIQTVPDLVSMTNPMNYIAASDALFFIQHGSVDCRMPLVQIEDLAEALATLLAPKMSASCCLVVLDMAAFSIKKIHTSGWCLIF